MARARTIYNCQSCGNTSYRWLGRCPECGSWNSYLEERVEPRPRGGESPARTAPEPITSLGAPEEGRISTGIEEFDRTLGGGMVPGSAILVGGDPGIGKSTLLLQVLGGLAAGGLKVLYVTGEESPRQIRLRGERLGCRSENLIVYAENSLERVMEVVERLKPGAVVIDSVQTLFSSEIESSPGSLSQVREVSSRLITLAKRGDFPLFLVGHVTKEGYIAGPMTLEHMVDTVLYFEGDRSSAYRVLRAVKNRFGSIMEIGVFEMKEEGLREVSNPSEVFLAERPEGATGSCVVPSLEGTRTVLVEVQSLVCPTIFGIPRRTVVGVDLNKVVLLAAVLEKKAGLRLANHDIFIKVAAGLRLNEPAVDLGIAASIASNFIERPVDQWTVVFGEVGLAGEVRAVSSVEPRVKEASKLGFKRCVLPRDNARNLKPPNGIELIPVSTVKGAIEKLF